jgi:hypothetical protein
VKINVQEELLKARLDEATVSSTTSQEVTGPIPLSGVQMTAPVGSCDSAATVESTERLLTLMDAYRGQLSDATVSLRQMAPTVQEMASTLPDLEAACERLPSDDGLRQVATEAMVTARTEILRFERGDYIG